MRWDGVMKERRDGRMELAASWAPFHRCINSPQPHPATHTISISGAKRHPQQCSHTVSDSAISEANKHVDTHFMAQHRTHKLLTLMGLILLIEQETVNPYH